MKRTILKTILLTSITLPFVTPVCHAASYTWTATEGGPLSDGGGNWDPTGGTTWLNGTSQVYGPWGNTNVDEAIFGVGSGAAGTITVSSVTANKITFNAPGSGYYTLSSGTISLAGTTPTITAASGVTATIGSTLAGTAGLTKAGAGTLILTDPESYTGATIISAGTLALSGGDNLLTTSGTVNFSGSSTLDIGSTNETFTALGVTTDGVTGTVQGAGTLTLTGASFSLAPSAGSATRALNMSGLSNFVYNNTAGTFEVDGMSVSTARGDSATVTLAANSTITAANLNIGKIGATNPAGTINTATFYLGQNTAINTNTIWVSNSMNAGQIGYLAGTNAPTLTIRGADGVSRVTTMNVGNYGYGNTAAGTVDLTTNVTGISTLNALINTLTIGTNNRGSSFSIAYKTQGTFTMGAGTLDALTMVIGQITAGSTNTVTGSTISGTFNSGAGGTVKVSSLVLGDNNISSGSTQTLTGTFNLNGGATLFAQSIAPGLNGASATITRTFNWNSGTIQNYDASTDLTISTGLTTFALVGTGTHAFDLGGGRTGTVNQAMSNTGALTKLDAGTLTLTATNTYTGTTTISGGTLQLGNGATTGSLSTSSSIINNASLVFKRSNTLTQGTDFANAISGTGAVTQAGSGTTVLSGTNTYAGGTTVNAGTLIVGGSISASAAIAVNGGILQFNAAQALGPTATVALGGGTLNLNGNGQMAGPLSLTAGTSTIDFGVGNSGAVFTLANSSAATWQSGATLSIADWNGSLTGGGSDELLFSSSTGLTAGQIADISFLNPSGMAQGVYNAQLLPGGEIVPVPEPTALAAMLGGLTVLGLMRRRNS